MRFVLLSLSLLALAACGADGAPEPPAAKAAQTPSSGVKISGDARVGVVYNE